MRMVISLHQNNKDQRQMAKADIRRPPISYVQALLVVLGY